MVDNFKHIEQYLTFASADDFYHLTIIKRRKENPELKTNSYMVKSYTITSIDYLEMVRDEVVMLCKFHNARAYINLNVRSFEKCAYFSLKKLSDILLSKSFVSAKRVFDSVAMKYSGDNEKKWLIDIDGEKLPSPLMIAHIEHQCKPNDPNKIICIVNTVNGFHLITKPFNMTQFKEKYPNIDVKKNSPTLLFYPN
jgi:hypothetical protein